MASDLQCQISQLEEKATTLADLHGLITCATTRLGKPDCTSISLLGRGCSNVVFKLTFSDGSQIAASVCHHFEEKFVPLAKESEVATMQFIRSSGLFPDVPVPEVYAWDTTFTNPARSPYVLMEVMPGVTLDSMSRSRLRGLNAMNTDERLSVVKSFAELQASLSVPLPFKDIGSILRDGDKFVVGPLITLSQKILGGPYKNLSDLWSTMLERQIVSKLNEWGIFKYDPPPYAQSKSTPEQFADLLQLLSALIPHFVPSHTYSPMVLHHPDIALRNVFFDPNDFTKIVGVIDWGGAQILPLMLSATFPRDLFSEGDYPFRRVGFPDEKWITVSNDWTTLGDKSLLPDFSRFIGAPPEKMAKGNVERYYLRQYFSNCFGKKMSEIHNDHELSHATLFVDAPYYLKFHEVMLGGLYEWMVHKDWIRETYWRLRIAGHDPGKDQLIVGPNVYHSSVKKPICDLSAFEDSHEPKDADICDLSDFEDFFDFEDAEKT